VNFGCRRLLRVNTSSYTVSWTQDPTFVPRREIRVLHRHSQCSCVVEMILKSDDTCYQRLHRGYINWNCRGMANNYYSIYNVYGWTQRSRLWRLSQHWLPHLCPTARRVSSIGSVILSLTQAYSSWSYRHIFIALNERIR
jgi:hypothetical protein